MDGRNSKVEREPRLGRRVWVSYLVTAAFLAASRIALHHWLNRRLGTHATAEMDQYLWWLFPEFSLAIIWTPTNFYMAWGSVVTFGSFVFATPILLVGWLRQRHLIVQITLCGLTIPAVTVLLLAIVRLLGLIE